MSKKLIYIYPAEVKKNKGYELNFIDFEDCKAKGEDIEEALENAREVLAATINDKLNNKEELPDPSEMVKGKTMMMVDVNINVYRFKHKHKAITRAVTLPVSMNEKVKASGINVSALLQEVLKEKLGIED